MPWKPALSNKLFNGLLLQKVQLEERSANFLERFYISASLKLSSHALQLEEPSCGERHNEKTEGREAVEEETVYSTLDFYLTSELPDTLAVVRFSSEFEGIGYSVCERHYPDTAEGYCKIQQDIPEALSIGIDVAVLSHIDPETLPEINQFLVDAPADMW